jgi:HK97 family phage portal protein
MSLISALMGRPGLQASRADYIRDWLTGNDVDGGYLSESGIVVAPADALRVAALNRGINVLAHSIASIPLGVYKRLPNGGKESAPDHPAYQTLHTSPNAWMTSFRWRHLQMVRAIIYGQAANQIIPNPGGGEQLIPLQPETTKVADQLASGKLIYTTKDLTATGYGPERRLSQDEVFCLQGLSMDGKQGIPLGIMAKSAIGLSLAAEKHGSMFLRNGARFSGLLSADGQLDENDRKQSEASWRRAYGGPTASGMVPVLSGGLKFQSVSYNNRDSQWLEARAFQIEEVLRFIGVPGVLCGYADKTATYAAAEQFFLMFVIHTVRPWTETFAHELNHSVVVDPENYFAAFTLDPLLQGDIKTRYSAHQQAILAGWKNRNEVRQEEGMNPGPDELDEFLSATNLAPAGSPGAGEPPPPAPLVAPAAPPADDDPEDQARVGNRKRAEALARKLVRKEVAAIAGSSGRMGLARRYASDSAGYRVHLEQFFDEHEGALAEDLAIPRSRAAAYCRDWVQTLTSGGLGEFEKSESDRVAALVEIALGGEA